MKKLILSLCLIAGATTASAQGYNRISLSYNNDHYSFNKLMKYETGIDGFSTNGFGIDYRHGFRLGSMPMFIETGANVNFNFGSKDLFDYDEDEFLKMKMINANVQIPVNYVYRFNITDKFSVSPYAGLNFKVNLIGLAKEDYDGYDYDDDYGYDYDDYEGDWSNLYSKDDMDGDTWNRFQLGWQVGVGFQYRKLYLGVQYGTDFIPAYSYSDGSVKARVNTGSLKVSLGFSF